MALVGTPAPFTFNGNMHVMVLNVPHGQANIDFVTDAFNRAEIGNVYSISISDPQPNGLFRIIVGLDWFKTSQTSHIWQGTILDNLLKAQLCVTLTDRWIVIPVPVDPIDNKLWQEDVVVEWVNDEISPLPEVMSLENIAIHTQQYNEYLEYCEQKYHNGVDIQQYPSLAGPSSMFVPDHVVVAM